MRAILHGFHEAMHEPMLARITERLNIDYCQLTYDAFRPTLPSTVRTVLHLWTDLNWAQYLVNWHELRPLDEDLLTGLSRTESMVLKMFDRLDPVHSQRYQDRKNLYLKHVRYWNHVLLEDKIDVFVALNMPHEMFDYILYDLCRLHRIPTVIAFQTQVSDSIAILDDWQQFSARIGSSYAELSQKYRTAAEADIELSGRFKRDFETQTGTRAPTPFYMNIPAPAGPSLPKKISGAVSRIFDKGFRSKLLTAASWREQLPVQLRAREQETLSREMRETYDRLATTPDLNRKFIYFPLHYQPEMTTSPLAGSFVEQPLIAQLLAATMPDDVHLYIKEHPKQVNFAGRYQGYYQELQNLPRTILVPKSFDTFELSSRCAAVATASGTAGWEALFREKPVFLFGHNFYQHAAGVFRIRSAEDCRLAMHKIFVEHFRPSRKDIKVFLNALAATTFEGYLASVFKEVSAVSPEQNETNIVEMLCAEVSKAPVRRTTP